jgi:hypothetical protein
MNSCVSTQSEEIEAATSALESCIKMCYANKRRGSIFNILTHVISKGTNYDAYSDRELLSL